MQSSKFENQYGATYPVPRARHQLRWGRGGLGAGAPAVTYCTIGIIGIFHSALNYKFTFQNVVPTKSQTATPGLRLHAKLKTSYNVVYMNTYCIHGIELGPTRSWLVLLV